MSPSEQLAMQIGYYVICAGVVMILALILLAAIWIWNEVLWRIAEQSGSVASLREFLRWKRIQAVKSSGENP